MADKDIVSQRTEPPVPDHQEEVLTQSPVRRPLVYSEALDTDKLFEARLGIASKGWPQQSRILYRDIVKMIEQAAHKADYSDSAEFHGMLWMMSRLSAGDYVRKMIEVEQDDLHYSPLDHMSGNKETFRTKLSRWINGKASPKSLRVRQRIIASALHALRKSADTGTAIPLRIPSDTRRCAKEPGAPVIGFTVVNGEDEFFKDEV